MSFSLGLERSDGGGRGIEVRDLVFFADVPEARSAWPGGNPLEHDLLAAVKQGSVDDIAVARDPPNVRGTPEDVVGSDLENVFKGFPAPYHITRGGVNQTFGGSGGAGSIDDKQRIFRVHFHRFKFARRFG